ncbi:MAG: CD225/dispanin family protein [Bacteroidia bacterium]|nr:CD225/dispanin family protein [Bacteroidia bacterium]
METTSNQTPPKTWLVESILVTLFCCLPFGIAGIVNAAKVESKFQSGDIQGSNEAAANAKKWTTIGFWGGLAIAVIYIIISVIIYLGKFR